MSEEPDLPEEVAGTERGDDVVAFGCLGDDVETALHHDEEVVGRIALPDHRNSRTHALLAEDLGHVLEGRARGAAEDRKSAQRRDASPKRGGICLHRPVDRSGLCQHAGASDEHQNAPGQECGIEPHLRDENRRQHDAHEDPGHRQGVKRSESPAEHVRAEQPLQGGDCHHVDDDHRGTLDQQHGDRDARHADEGECRHG